jgi:glycosyltransferase involved in cell wall biosynthesis
MLEYLVTDAWVPPSSVAKLFGSGLAGRFHGELRNAPVKAFTSSFVLFETLARARSLGMWPRILARNEWFQHKVVSFLRRFQNAWCLTQTTNSYQTILLSYSYTALEPFRYAKSRGWKTVLIQIDPGPEEEKIVAEEAARMPELAVQWQPAPRGYWEYWRKECELADRIVVNSEWSREALVRGGVPVERISIIPLAYEARKNRNQKSEIPNQKLQRSYPARFTQERPMRVLFLGLINLRKGVARLLEAARSLRDEPVEFWMVGPVEIANASAVAELARVKWFGPATRKQAAEFYRTADVFILPTLSDGFAITQLEAQAHGLPVITSKNCGNVVEDGVNGMILEEPTATRIASALRNCVANPDRLEKLAFLSRVRNKFTIQALAHELQHLDEMLEESPG